MLSRILYSLTFLALLVNSAVGQDNNSVTDDLLAPEKVWYMQPWVWVVGGVAILLLLISIFSRGSRRNKNKSRTDRVIITKTVRTETDTD